MRIRNNIISYALSTIILMSSIYGCGSQGEAPDNENASSTKISISTIDSSSELSEVKDTKATPSKVNPEQNETTEKDNKINDIQENYEGIEGYVSSLVENELQCRGYTTEPCMAFSEDGQYEAVGIGYYFDDYNLFDSEEYTSVGFLSVVGDDEEYHPIPDNAEMIVVEPIEGSQDENKYNILAYACDSLESNHFVYDDKYVLYYQLDSTTIKYDVFENTRDNYKLELGSLYDYDNDTYIYNAELFGEYETHSGTELFSETDYEKLEAELKKLSEEQEKNGYSVDEINIVYISPENIEAYLASNEEETFFGYSVKELENSLGPGTALVYTENGFETAEYYEQNPGDYDWKTFLGKIGVGCGIILVGAVLTPLTGGASFGCALITITTVAAGTAISQGLGTLAIETVVNVIKGEDFKTAIMHASCKGLDAFANGFMIGAVIGSVGMVSGTIKPIACFAAGTMIAVPDDMKYKKIEDIKIGDSVLSYNLENGNVETDIVSKVYCHSSKELIEVIINGERIKVTKEHPFYRPDINGWMTASDLQVGDNVLLANGFCANVEAISEIIPTDTLVYNFTVKNNHNYFVGVNAILVHNECKTVEAARKEGVKKAWEKEVEAVKNNKSKYNWTKKEKMELLKKGKVKGYQGAHIVDVNVDPSKAADPIILFSLKRMCILKLFIIIIIIIHLGGER